MASSDSGPVPDPIDPVYAALFRPDDEQMFESIVDPVVDPRDEEALVDARSADDASRPPAPADVEPEAPAIPPSIVDTGRLFRSQGVTGHGEAVLALGSDHFGRLRTLERRTDGAAPIPVVTSEGGVLPDAGPLEAGYDAALDAAGDVEEAAVVDEPRRRGRRRRKPSPSEERGSSHRSRHITGGAVYLIVIGVTVLVGFANALLADGDIGWPTGLALLISSVYAALTVRRSDDVVAIIVPPLAFALTAMTAGQLFLGSAEGSILNRAVIVFFALADNWMWVIGSTAAALVIVLVRRRRG